MMDRADNLGVVFGGVLSINYTSLRGVFTQLKGGFCNVDWTLSEGDLSRQNSFTMGSADKGK